ncbi:transcriptional pleiotropic regulator of transition state genes [Bacillus fengqiuensis]|nr:transcriptional pleiotropic regulator of transition state genes [Bacillus fengqiuensis]
MKSTGIVRKMDELGRIVLPKELRRILDIENKDPLEIFVDKERIILKKYKPYKACQVSGEVSNQNLSFANGKVILSPESAEKLVNEIQLKLNVIIK